MLIRFRVENHRSLRDEQTLSLVASDLDPGDPRLIAAPGLALLPVAAIYGANAAGKSNLLHALAFMRRAVIVSHRFWGPDEGVPREPFAFRAEVDEKVSLFEVDMVLEGVRHRYGFTVDGEAVLEEWLYAWPHDRQQIWFKRDRQAVEFGKNLRGDNRAIEKQTRPNSLFLSTAAQSNHAQLVPLYLWFSGHLRLAGTPLGSTTEPGRAVRLLGTPGAPNGPRARMLELLRRADLGIADVKVEERRLLFRHAVEGASREVWLPLEQESMGTVALVGLLPAVAEALDDGGVLVVDDLDASLHPALAVEVLRLFQDPARNPRRAQLLFSTHGTTLLGNLLGDPPLCRDQVWLAEKDAAGATVVYPLTDFKPRKLENIERGYLQGRYGAIPFLGGLRELPEVPSSATPPPPYGC